jgi:hypothetical protein
VTAVQIAMPTRPTTMMVSRSHSPFVITESTTSLRRRGGRRLRMDRRIVRQMPPNR